MKSIDIVLSYKCIREQNQFLLYVAGRKFNILSSSVIAFTLSYILFIYGQLKYPTPLGKHFVNKDIHLL